MLQSSHILSLVILIILKCCYRKANSFINYIIFKSTTMYVILSFITYKYSLFYSDAFAKIYHIFGGVNGEN